MANKEGEEVDREALDDDPDEVQDPRHQRHLPLLHPTQHQSWKKYQKTDFIKE